MGKLHHRNKKKSIVTAMDVLRELKNSNPPIRNIVLFIPDALRWDYLPEAVARRGVTFKTVAASLMTSSSFPSMLTALYPPKHGVYTFTDRLSRNIKSLMNLNGFNTSLWTENTWINYDPLESSPIHRLLRQDKRISLDEIMPPFIYLEDEKGGHCPFGWNLGDEDYKEWECQKFFYDFGSKGSDALLKRYRKGVDRSVEEFEKRLDVLEKRGLTQETLVIYTSDHGELLGEHGGNVGHGEFTSPEIVYVPTVFIHPTLPRGVTFENEGVIRHIDLYPTILDLLGLQTPYVVDGVSLIASNRIPVIGCNYSKIHIDVRRMRIPLRYKLEESSVWDKNGGHIFRDSNSFVRLFHSTYRIILGSITASYLRGGLKRNRLLQAAKNYLNALKYRVRFYIKYGSPNFSKEDARMISQKNKKGTILEIRRSIIEIKRRGRI